MESIKENKIFIGSLLPDGYAESCFEYENYYACRCIHINGKYMDNKNGEDGTWEIFCKKLELEFGNNLMEILNGNLFNKSSRIKSI